MERVLDVYKRPYSKNFPVICMDETPKQLIEESRHSLPAKPGTPKRIDYEYIRHGVGNILMANEPLSGSRLVEVTERKTKKDWAKFIKRIADEMCPQAAKITLVMDNYGTHKASAFYEVFPPEQAKRLWDRFEFVYTPKHGSWLNMAEIENHVMSGQCLNRHLPSIEKLTKEVNSWQQDRNKKNKKINWQFTTKDAKIKLKKLYPSFDG
jgi:hypothetical protein